MSPRGLPRGDGWGEDTRMTVGRARSLRKRMTPQELTLWFQLRQLKDAGWRFRRQSPEDKYILDFVCREARLVVEVDGAQHGEPKQMAHDAVRDAFLEARGFTVLRFWASEISFELDGVMLRIQSALEAADPTRTALHAASAAWTAKVRLAEHAREDRIDLREVVGVVEAGVDGACVEFGGDVHVRF